MREWLRLRRWLVVLTAVLAVAVLPGAVHADAGNLNVRDIQQEASNWCWATVIQTNMDYLGVSGPSQCDIVKAGKNTVSCADVPGSTMDMLRAYDNWGFTGVNGGALFYAAVVSEIDGQRPISAGWKWYSGGGHMVSLDGYETVNGTEWVTYMDPAVGKHNYMTYKWFRGGSGSSSDHEWVESIYHLAYTYASGGPDPVRAAAVRGLAFLKEKAAERPSLFGLASADEAKKLVLGESFRIHYVDTERLATESNPQSLLGLSYPAAVWEYFGVVDGAPRVLITVALQDGNYEAVRVGGDASSLAAALGTLRTAASGRAGEAEVKIVKAGPVYYAVAPVGGSELVVAAVPPGRMPGLFDRTRGVPARDVLRYLQKQLKEGGPGYSGEIGIDPVAGKPGTRFDWWTVGICVTFCGLGAFAAGFWMRGRRMLKV